MNNPDTLREAGAGLPISETPHFGRDAARFPNAWVLHCMYSEYDDDLESQSLWLGLGGIQLLAYFVLLATMAVLLYRPDLWWESTGPEIFQAVLLLAPAMAIFGLLALMSMTLNGSFVLRLTLTVLGAIVLVLLVTIVHLIVYGNYSFTKRRGWQGSEILWPSVVLVALAWTIVIPLLIALPGVVARVWNSSRPTSWRAKLVASVLLMIAICTVPILVAVCANQANHRLRDFEVSIIATVYFLSGLIVSVWLAQWRQPFKLLPAGAKWNSNRRLSSPAVIIEAGLFLACVLDLLPTPESTQWPTIDISKFITLASVTVTLALGWIAKRMEFRVARLAYKLALGAACLALVPVYRDIIATWILYSHGFAGIAVLFGVGGAVVGWLLAQWMVLLLSPKNRRRWMYASLLGFGAVLGESALLLAWLAELSNWVNAFAALNICLFTASIVVGAQTGLWFVAAKWLKACGWSIVLIDQNHKSSQLDQPEGVLTVGAVEGESSPCYNMRARAGRM